MYRATYVFLLLVDMPDLEPDIGMGKGTRRIAEDTLEAFKRVFILALLLVNDAEAKEDLVGLVKV